MIVIIHIHYINVIIFIIVIVLRNILFVSSIIITTTIIIIIIIIDTARDPLPRRARARRTFSISSIFHSVLRGPPHECARPFWGESQPSQGCIPLVTRTQALRKLKDPSETENKRKKILDQ